MNSKCYLCGDTKFKKREGKVRDNNALEILECSNCGLVFLSSFEHIKETFYEESKMHDGQVDLDLDAWINETAFDDNRRFNLYSEILKNKDILDFGCGTGGFLIRAKTKAKKVYGIEPEKRLEEHFKKNGLEVYTGLENFNQKVDYIFLFHVLEHIAEPINVLERLRKNLKPNGKIIIEVPNSDDALLTLYNNKAFSEFTYWSPHLYLYNEKTLSALLEKSGYKTDKIEQQQRYSLANHLYWLSKGKPGGHIIWSFIDNLELNKSYESFLASIGKCDTIVGEFLCQ